MENSVEEYTHLAVGMVVAVVVLLMIASVLSLRRETSVMLQSRTFYDELAEQKQRFDTFNDMVCDSSGVVSIISQYADELDIFVSGTALNDGMTLRIDESNRKYLEYLTIPDSELEIALGLNDVGVASIATRRDNIKELANNYGVFSGVTLGQMIYGNSEWDLKIIYNGGDVATDTVIPNIAVSSNITGVRFEKKVTPAP